MTINLSEQLIAFLPCKTPASWVTAALLHQDELLIDHANCEKKAANTALKLIFRYTEYPDLLIQLSRLAREELRHFEQVLAIMQKRKIGYRYLGASRYASQLIAQVRTHEPEKLIDTLIVGAFIEARSCERFAALIPFLDDELKHFYSGLVKSESRHFTGYLSMANKVSRSPVNDRVQFFALVEQKLVESKDNLFRFHSGIPSVHC
ncbi:hypothetical protein CI610_03251 [invertebrate metagenome]|uniref:tRNA-(Ms[2]io[6]A)-hydroxylase n=1 Tax=invertebrate metagenome TaxID=1711999 RepID=A0A2H9T3L8_9ZZZZ